MAITTLTKFSLFHFITWIHLLALTRMAWLETVYKKYFIVSELIDASMCVWEKEREWGCLFVFVCCPSLSSNLKVTTLFRFWFMLNKSLFRWRLWQSLVTVRALSKNPTCWHTRTIVWGLTCWFCVSLCYASWLIKEQLNLCAICEWVTCQTGSKGRLHCNCTLLFIFEPRHTVA